MKRIGVLTSGGDAPGMNAAVRAVVRTGIHYGLNVFGIQQGYEGLLNGKLLPLGTRDVGGILQRGGTILGSARCEEFKTEQGRQKAMRILNQFEIDGLVIIGGNGSQKGSYALSQMGLPVAGVASTIDNDLYGADITIGVDTALNIALEAIDRLKTTASSHQRAFLVEVMGREYGELALVAGISGGVEAVVMPVVEADPEEIGDVIKSAYERGKGHALVVVAEGATYNATRLMDYFKEHEERLGFSLRSTILGHVQRGGNPGAYDRILATRLGAAAVENLVNHNYGMLSAMRKGEISTCPLEEVVSNKQTIDLDLFRLAKILD